ncbi:MAG: hypothetical protein LC785_07210, partial [Acidobacteria bacterium]|nr:hypothetical protein [Acidobacteriota bacterium]
MTATHPLPSRTLTERGAKRALKPVVALGALVFFSLMAGVEVRASHIMAMNAKINGTKVENNGVPSNPTVTSSNGQFTFSFQAYGSSDTLNVTFTCTGVCTTTPSNFS